MNNLKKYLENNEEWLMQRILEYAVKQDYAKYTSTLKEAWRLSISKLTEIIALAIDKYGDEIPELNPDLDYDEDSMFEFGVESAQKHRTRGITIEMYLGFFKYYRQTYEDCIENSKFLAEDKNRYKLFIKRCFDRSEIAFCREWTGKSDSELLKELQDKNRNMTNEKNKYLTIFESILDPVIFIDKDGFIQNINFQGLKVFYNKQNSGSFYYNKSVPQNFHWLETEVKDFLENSRKEIILNKRLNILGEEKFFDIKISEMLDVSSKFIGLIIIMKDVTEEALVKQKLEKAKDEMEMTNAALSESNKKLVELNQQKDKFFEIISHDLRGPFNPIMGYLDLLKDADNYSDKCPEQKELIESIDLSVQNAFKLLNNLLEWGRVQSGEIRYNPKILNLKQIAEEIYAIIQSQCKQKGIGFKINIADSISVFADKYMMETIIRNIASNSIKFTKNGGEIKIEAEDIDDNVVIRISDTGVGIPPGNVDSIFEITSKYRTEGTNGEMGTGLGLILCKNFVEKNGGSIGVSSELGVGSEFTIKLLKSS